MIDWLFTNALIGLALAAIAGAFIYFFRPAPAVRHALWLVVVLKLVSPTGLVVSLPLPVNTSTPAPLRLQEIVVEEEFFTMVVTPSEGQSLEEAAAAAMAIQASPVPLPIPVEPPSLSWWAFDYRPYLLGLWLAGAVLMAIRHLRSTIRFARFAKRSSPAYEALVQEVALAAQQLGVHAPKVRVLPGLASPVMWCLTKPVLLWPAGLEGRLNGEGRRAVLAHELAHLRRRDHWTRRLEMVASVLHWWNPLFWIARRKMRSDAELACDAWAAGQVERRVYAEALLAVCSFQTRRRPAAAVGVAGEGRRDLQERLTMIMRENVPCRLAFGAKLTIVLMALAAVPAWTLGQAAPTPAAGDPQVQAIENQLKALSEKLEAIKAVKKAEGEKAKAAKTFSEAKEFIYLADLNEKQF